MRNVSPLLLAAFAAGAPLAASGQAELDADKLKALLAERTWVVAFYGDLTDKLRIAYWDFNADGTVCVRLASNPPKSPCGDTGKWRLEGNSLCWDLGWFGKQNQFQSVCGRARPHGDAYHFLDRKSQISLMAFRPHK